MDKNSFHLQMKLNDSKQKIMTKSFLTLVLSMLLLTGCFSDEEKYKDIVKNILTDPDSAQFKELRLSRRDNDVLCGELNAKNRMGGYVGYTRIVVETSGIKNLKAKDVFIIRFLSERENAAELAGAWKTFCE